METTANGTTTSTSSESSQQSTNSSQGTSTAQSSGGGASQTTPAGEGSPGALSQNTASVDSTDPAGAAYQPNFKYKVKDKDLEFDEFIKPAVTTKDVEAKIREMYEKASGLDEVKTARDGFKTQVEEWKGKYTHVEQSLKTLGSYVKNGDLDSFFSILNIPNDKIIKYAIEKLKYQEMTPEQRAIVDAQRDQQVAFIQAQVQNQTLQQQMSQLVQQQVAFELNQELVKPDIATAISAYETRTGIPGSFKAEVIRRGQYYEAVHKISPPASQLVSEILSLIGVQANAQPGGAVPPQGASGQTTPNQQQPKPVIPTFSGGGNTSPVKKLPSSIEDLRAMRQNLNT